MKHLSSRFCAQYLQILFGLLHFQHISFNNISTSTFPSQLPTAHVSRNVCRHSLWFLRVISGFVVSCGKYVPWPTSTYKYHKVVWVAWRPIMNIMFTSLLPWKWPCSHVITSFQDECVFYSAWIESLLCVPIRDYRSHNHEIFCLAAFNMSLKKEALRNLKLVWMDFQRSSAESYSHSWTHQHVTFPNHST